MIQKELKFFALNGVVSVVLAYGIYRGLVTGGLLIEVANGVAYFVGMLYGFFANKRLTFRNGYVSSAGEAMRYILLHTGTLLVNVSVNSIVLEYVESLPMGFLAAFLAAITVSTALNFMGLKYWVFKKDIDAHTPLDGTGAQM